MTTYTPPPATGFKFWITYNALEQFKLKVEPESRSLGDGALAKLLDDRIWAAHQAKEITTVIDEAAPNEDTRIVKIECRNGASLFVPMRMSRPNQYPTGTHERWGPGGRAQTALTVISPASVQTALSTGRWRRAVDTPAGDPDPKSRGSAVEWIESPAPLTPAQQLDAAIVRERAAQRELTEASAEVERLLAAVLAERRRE